MEFSTYANALDSQLRYKKAPGRFFCKLTNGHELLAKLGGKFEAPRGLCVLEQPSRVRLSSPEGALSFSVFAPGAPPMFSPWGFRLKVFPPGFFLKGEQERIGPRRGLSSKNDTVFDFFFLLQNDAKVNFLVSPTVAVPPHSFGTVGKMYTFSAWFFPFYQESYRPPPKKCNDFLFFIFILFYVHPHFLRENTALCASRCLEL